MASAACERRYYQAAIGYAMRQEDLRDTFSSISSTGQEDTSAQQRNKTNANQRRVLR